MLGSLALATAVAGALAQHDIRKPCDFPPEFTAQEKAFNYATNQVEQTYVVYDTANKRVYRREIDTGPGGTTMYTRILLFNEHREYNIDQRGGGCTYNTIPDRYTWQPWGVPKNASFQRQVILGLSAGATNWIEADVFTMQNARTGTASRSFTGYVTADKCAPISFQVAVRTAQGYLDIDQSISASFENMVLGIESPSVFNLPPDCRPAPRPGPSPGPAPGAKCAEQLTRDCAASKPNGATACFECLRAHQNDLRAAGCTPEAERAYCDPRY